jgi:3-deoxy-D-manno-octulosonic-acid transferase
LGAVKPEVFGNCKFDQAVEGLDVNPRAWATELGLDLRKTVIVVGSTRGEVEERFVLDALAQIGFNRIQVVHAPRHLERVDALCEEVRTRTGTVARRSHGEKGSYLVLDTYGELAKTYAVADIVVVGGGFEDLGGQNIIQPLAHGKPVLHGLYMQNFRDIAAMSMEAGASLAAASPEVLAKEIESLIVDPGKRERMGSIASELVARNLGASGRIASAVAYEARVKTK